MDITNLEMFLFIAGTVAGVIAFIVGGFMGYLLFRTVNRMNKPIPILKDKFNAVPDKPPKPANKCPACGSKKIGIDDNKHFCGKCGKEW